MTYGVVIMSMLFTRTSAHVEDGLMAAYNVLVVGAPKVLPRCPSYMRILCETCEHQRPAPLAAFNVRVMGAPMVLPRCLIPSGFSVKHVNYERPAPLAAYNMLVMGAPMVLPRCQTSIRILCDTSTQSQHIQGLASWLAASCVPSTGALKMELRTHFPCLQSKPQKHLIVGHPRDLNAQ